MELIFAVAIGVLMGSGVWLILRSRTFQVIMGLAMISNAVNLFIFGTAKLRQGRPPVIEGNPAIVNVSQYADPVPQALTLTAIVIGFGVTALFLVVLLVQRGLSSTDHVDGSERS